MGAGDAAKVIAFFIIVALVGMMGAMPGYFTAREAVRVDYETQYATCMQTSDLGQLTQAQVAAFNSCQARGGCYVSCGSACQQSDLTFTEYVAGEAASCPLLCTPQCLTAPTWRD